jgi:hypothetical protein
MNIVSRRIGLLCVVSLVVALCGCSLAGSIQRSAVDYNATVANYNDQMLIYTVLRARDEAPINILALSTITGALNMQAGIGSSTAYNSPGSSASRITSTAIPAISTSSSPTWSMASLNTRGFMLGIIQPISPMYVVSKWDTGIDREFLLRLLIKSINIQEDGQYHSYLNDPDSPEEMREFTERLHAWIPHMSMRALTVIEPLGPAYNAAAITRTTETWDETKKSGAPTRIETRDAPNPAIDALLGAYEHLVPLSGGSYYVGNARSTDGSVQSLQLYREFAQQVVLCVPRADLNRNTQGAEDDSAALGRYAQALKSAAKSGAGRGEANSAGQSIANGQRAGGRPEMIPEASLATNLKAERIAAVLPLAACGRTELVLPQYTEDENSANSGTYSHIEWRSIAEVIQYLGAVLRAGPAATTWTESSGGGTDSTHLLFSVTRHSGEGFATVDYRGDRYVIHSPADTPDAPVKDHSLQALSLLNELVSTAKVSSDIPNTQPIQIIP